MAVMACGLVLFRVLNRLPVSWKRVLLKDLHGISYMILHFLCGFVVIFKWTSCFMCGFTAVWIWCFFMSVSWI